MLKQLRYLLLFVFLVLLSFVACNEGGGKTGSAKSGSASRVAMAVNFITPSGERTAKAVSAEDLGITKLILEVIPATLESHKPNPIDLMAVLSSGSNSITIDDLTNFETYLFRVMAYDKNDRYLYGGQITAEIHPHDLTQVNLNCIKFNGFSPLEGKWKGVNELGTSVEFTVGANGVAEGTDDGGYKVSIYFAPATTAANYNMTAFVAMSGMLPDQKIFINASGDDNSVSGKFFDKAGVVGSWSASHLALTSSSELFACINEHLGLDPEATPTQGELESITDLVCREKNIRDLKGIESVRNLESLNLHINQIDDISPLADLVNLEELDLGSNQINDVSALQGLVNLIILELDDNKISDISMLQGLVKLEKLDLDDNQINNISSLQSLLNLKELWFGDNQINDISALQGLVNLERLWLYNNQINDVSPLQSLVNLDELWLDDNYIKDISPLLALTKLSTLVVSANCISDPSIFLLFDFVNYLSTNNNPRPDCP